MKKLFVIGIIAGITIASGILYWQITEAQTASGGLSRYFATASASSTLTYLGSDNANGTSTLLFSAAGMTRGQLGIQFTASNTIATLHYRFQYSNDAIDWFEADQIADIGSVAVGGLNTLQNFSDHASSTVTHRWRPGAGIASTTRKIVEIPVNSAFRFGRVQMFIPVGQDSGGVWAEAGIRYER